MENNSIANSNQSIREIMKMARESYNTSLNQTSDLMRASYKIAPTFLTDAAKWSTEDFDTMTNEEIQKIYDEYYVGSEESKLLQVEDIRKDLKACKGLSNSAYEMKKSFKEVQDLYNESVDEDWKRRNSKEYRDATLKRISDWKSEIEKMDPVKDARIIRDMRQKIEFMESTITLDFITERIKHVDREKDSIMRQFFSERYGSYSLDRCKSKSPKFGFDKDWYKFFFNLEENFLPEEYHAFNNLFLFNVMRFIGYQNPYNQKDRGMVQAIVSSLTGLVYHKFSDTDMENVIISLIKDYDSYFEDQREKFMSDNTTRPNHPVRLEQSMKADADRRNDLFAGMVKFGFDIPENATEMSTRDLQEYFNNKMEEMVSKNTVEKELHGDAEATEEDGVTKIRPTFLKDKYRNPVDLIDGKFYYFNQDEEGQESYNTVLGYFQSRGCTIGYQMFELKNPDVRTDVFAEDLTDSEKRAILEECRWNFWFFWRYVLKLKASVNSLLTIDSILSDHNTLEETMRQSGKTTTITAYGDWAFLFHEDHYPEFAIINTNMSDTHLLCKKMEGFINQTPKLIKDHVRACTNEFSGQSFTSIAKAVKYLEECDKISETNPALVIVDDMEYVEDINNVEDLKALTNLNVHLVMTSNPNDPEQVPALMESFRKDPELIYNPYEINNTTLRDFHTAVAIHNFKDTNAIAYITVDSRRLRTNEEIAAMVNGTEENTDGNIVRSIWCKHVNDEFVQYCKSIGVDITAEGYDPFITDEMVTVSGMMTASGDVGTKTYPSSLVDQIKKKMDTEGTYSVMDALTGELVYIKPAKKKE